MGATLTFLYQSLVTDLNPRGKTKAQRELEKGIDGGQAKMDALADQQWKQAAALANVATGKNGNDRGLLRETSASEDSQKAEKDILESAGLVSRRKRLIVLADGKGQWNTGVWPGWGYDPNEVTLNWAAAGVVVKKDGCPVTCEWTRDQSRIKEADAWIGEIVNHPKFGIPESQPIAWPEEHERRDNPKALAPGPKPTQIPSRLPLVGIFYYEAEQSYPKYTLASEAIRRKIDFSITPSKSRATLPISMTCPWGSKGGAYDFVRPMPEKTPGNFMLYWNEHGIIRQWDQYVDRMFQLAEKAGSVANAGKDMQGKPNGIHAFIHKRNTEMPPGARDALANRLKFFSTYKFCLVTEPIDEADWVEPELSQMFLQGCVPVYLGPTNSVLYSPGPRAFVNIRDFKTPESLMNYLEQFRGDDEATMARYKSEFFSWKDKAMATFMMDEQGQTNPIGTGHGVIPPPKGLSQETLARQIQAFQPVPSGGEDNVEPLSIVRQRVDAAATANDGGRGKFDFVAEAQWRNFRRRLDQCVHYAECRACQLVTLLTA
jgi:Glycosyltransferase family 10 (fucosyltransferase) C-term